MRSLASATVYHVQTKSGYKHYSFYEPSENDKKEYGDVVLGSDTLWNTLYSADESDAVTKRDLTDLFREISTSGAIEKIIEN